MVKINTQQIQYFLAVARTLNFTQAAQELYISQPSLSKQISQLESVLGMTLFQRNTKTVRMTPGGMYLQEYLRHMYEELELAIDEAKQRNERAQHLIRVGIAETEGVIEAVQPVLETFERDYPDMELQYEIYSFKELQQRFSQRELDLIFTFSSEIPHQHEYLIQTLCALELSIIVPRSNPLSERERLQVRDLKDETFCVLSDTFAESAERYIVRHCREEGFTPRRLRIYPNLMSLALGLRRGDGVTLGYREFFEHLRSQNDQLRFYPVDTNSTEVDLVACANSDNDNTSVLMEYLRRAKTS